MNEYIKKYIDQNSYIFPCNADKSPMTLHGFKDAVNNYEIASKQFYKDDLLIGLPTGKINKIVIIDFDVNKKIPGTDDIDMRSVDELIEEVQNNYGELPDTFAVETPSGGRHFYYSITDDSEEIRSGNRFIDKSLPIDIRAEGGYAIAPDGINYIVYDDVDGLDIDNFRERCTPLPQWIYKISKKQSEDTNPENLPDNVLPESEIKEIRSALAFLSSDDRDLWVKIGMSLKSTGSPSAYGLWNEWSKTSDKYNPDDMEKRWRGLKPSDITIASLFHEAKQAGWITTYNQVSVAIPTIIMPNEQQIKELQIEHKREPFPVELLRPDGLVGEIIDYILSKSIMEQPVYALAAGLCAVGTLAGRKVQTSSGTRTNIYCLNVGGSGSGKEAPRKMIKELFHAAGCGNLCSVEDLASDVAIVTELSIENSQLFLIDEVGRFFEANKNSRSAHLTKITDVLLKVYGSADEIFKGKSYADATKKIEIDQPNLCLLGTTVPDALYKGLNYEVITNGFLSRMMIFETDNNRPRKNRNKDFLSSPPPELIKKIKALHQKPINMHPAGNIDQVLTPRPQLVEKTENAKTMLDDYDDFIFDLRNELEARNDKKEAIYNRSSQIAEQIALILAVGSNIDNPVITEKEMSYGIRLSEYLANHMKYVIENHMARNDHEHSVLDVLEFIRKRGCLTYEDVVKETQNLLSHTRNDILNTLKTSGQIDDHLVGVGEHARRIIVATKEK